MPVIDTSAIIAAIANPQPNRELIGILLKPFAAPAVVDFEFLNTMRALVRRNAITDVNAEEAVRTFYELPIIRHEADILAPDIWKLRENMTAYDASYLALSHLLKTTLITCDQKFARTPLPSGYSVDILTLPSSQ